MCDTTGNHNHKHGVRTPQEKACGDIRNNMALQMDLLTKIEAQLAVIGDEDYPMVGAIVHSLEHLKADLKRGVAEQMQLLNALDPQQAGFFSDDEAAAHDHDHEHAHAH